MHYDLTALLVVLFADASNLEIAHTSRWNAPVVKADPALVTCWVAKVIGALAQLELIRREQATKLPVNSPGAPGSTIPDQGSVATPKFVIVD